MHIRRMQRVNSLLKEVISETIRFEIKEQNLTELLTITAVDTSRDLQNAKVYVSVIQSDEERKETIELLQNLSKKISFHASRKVRLRHFPSLLFKLDTTSENYIKIDKILKDISESERETT